jgi:hypothetical protein
MGAAAVDSAVAPRRVRVLGGRTRTAERICFNEPCARKETFERRRRQPVLTEPDDGLMKPSRAASVALPHAPPQAGVKLTGTTDHGQRLFDRTRGACDPCLASYKSEASLRGMQT